ncbi:putative deoxyribonuclease V [Haemophilus sputorum HK 2154]|uniref:pyrimidine dimer DNA glycosylase/endonuclease V n=1 Tax=Haemophilus sputorum TaxID=1078480 RepID=UPI00027A6B7D|nr:pyrimidine dimer DNA glycosylase/endonuclease V [Haemophilus sputorum]EJP30480.1 putative deoxyribonuclease V [Haemophilus sputorum HK 2154]
MTRINLVPPAELCDQHLLAEHRELTRIPNAVAKGKFSLKGQPSDYKLGEGHVRFFFNKLMFLKKRYDLLHEECLARGFQVQYFWSTELPEQTDLWLDYQPTENALKLNRERIALRMPAKARFTPRKEAI